MKVSQRIRAFTLVELLVVIGIIALLISILLPALTKAREQALIVSCSAQLKDFSNAILLYGQDNKGSFPGPLPGQIRSGYSASSGLLQNFLWRYLKLPDPAKGTAANPVRSNITLCPGYRAKASGAFDDNYTCTYSMQAYDPWGWTGYSGAGANSYLGSPLQDAKYGHPTSGPFAGNIMPLKLAQVFDASEQPFIADLDQGEVRFEVGPGGPAFMSEYPNHGGKAEQGQGVQESVICNAYYMKLPAYSKYATNPPRNVLYCDGHVATRHQSGPVLAGDLARYGPVPADAVPTFTN